VAGNWMGMVQSRASLLEQAVAKALGGNRQLVLEASSGAVALAPVVAPPTPKPVTPPVIQQIAPSATAPAPTNQPAPIAAPVASPKPAVEAKAPQREQPIVDSGDHKPKPETRATAATPADIDRHAKTLANFFNGEVLEIDPLNESQEHNKTT